MDQPVKVDYPRLQAQRLQRQLAQVERQALEEVGGQGQLLLTKLNAMPVACRLMARQLSLIFTARCSNSQDAICISLVVSRMLSAA